MDDGTLADAENSLAELAPLAETAGSQVLDGLIQRRDKPDPATYIGSGKAKELRDIVVAAGADTVICDGELTPGQLRQLEDVVKVKVVDRTALILDIFAQHASSKEGKAQVELAQMQYMLPRLRGWGESLSRQVGGRAAGGVGIGGRGPGETKIEIDRRRITARMAKLRREIAGDEDGARRQARAAPPRHVPSVALAGYTNAGKSSLLNRLTDAGVLVENALFATLDPTVRRCQATDGRAYTLADTVGFVRHLPHQLIEAFRSTLEEVADADLILHVVDAVGRRSRGADPAVREVLADIDALDVPEQLVFNKVDAADPRRCCGCAAWRPTRVRVGAHRRGLRRAARAHRGPAAPPGRRGGRAGALHPRRPRGAGPRRRRGARHRTHRRRHAAACPGQAGSRRRAGAVRSGRDDLFRGLVHDRPSRDQR